MKLAAIPAPQWAERFAKGEYHMVIAPWLIEYSRYLDYYGTAFRPNDTFVILDNGAFEKRMVEAQTLGNLAREIRASCVVLPDVLRDSKATCQAAWQALQYLHGVPEVMFVPQATTEADWFACLDAWLGVWTKQKMSWNLSIGIPTHRAPMPESYLRKDILAHWKHPYPIHLLGVRTLGEEFAGELRAAKEVGVRSVDTSLPFALAAQGRLLHPDAVKVPLGEVSIYHILQPWVHGLTYLNTLILRGWCESHEMSPWIDVSTLDKVAALLWNGRELLGNPGAILEACSLPTSRWKTHRSADGRLLKIRLAAEGEKPEVL